MVQVSLLIIRDNPFCHTHLSSHYLICEWLLSTFLFHTILILIHFCWKYFGRWETIRYLWEWCNSPVSSSENWKVPVAWSSPQVGNHSMALLSNGWSWPDVWSGKVPWHLNRRLFFGVEFHQNAIFKLLNSSRIAKCFYLSYLSCSQTWLNPLVDGCQCCYATKVKRKKTLSWML